MSIYLGDVLVRDKTRATNRAVARRVRDICESEDLIIIFQGTIFLCFLQF